MCPGGIPRGDADAQWKQIGSIARADMPWSAVEWRLARQMNCTNEQHRPQKATGGRMQCFRQIIARGNVPWNALEWRLVRQMNCTNAQHRTQKATGGHGRQDAMSPANHRARQCALEVSPEGVPTLNGNKLVPSRDLHFLNH